ncbi:MAG: methyltransferase [Cellulosilyticaceae bacterium]
MIKSIYQNIVNEQDVRKNLIALRKELKEENNITIFLDNLSGEYSVLYALLEAEDAKTRKNIALIMGELAIPEFMNKLYEAYQKEDKLFVKSDYLVAIRQFDYRSLLGELKKRLDFLTSHIFEENSLKHINEETRILTEMVITLEKPSTHKFIGYNELSDLILLTNRNHQQVTLDQIKKGSAEVFNAGVIVRTKDLREIMNIRTYSNILFHLPKVTKVANDPLAVAKAIYEGGLLDFLKVRHEGEYPYYFRIEIKSKMELDKKSTFAKKMASELERVSGRELINSTSNYEVEIRLVEGKDGLFNVLIRLYTIEDERFQYRKNAVSASIHPVNAALIAELTKDYLKEDADVLDPFCGVGTMLIERNKLVPAKVMYGVDIFGEAIDGAIENVDLDNTDIYFINKDFFDFTHKYLFDEIFTNMPTRMGRKTEDEIEVLYERFFEKASDLLKDKATLIMYTRNKELVHSSIRNRKQYTVVKEYEISRKEAAYVCIVQVKKFW